MNKTHEEKLKEARLLINIEAGKKRGLVWSEQWKNKTQEERDAHMNKLVEGKNKKKELKALTQPAV